MESWQTRRESERLKHRNGNGFGAPLDMAVRLWPTPTTQDAENNGGPSQQERHSPPLNVQAAWPTPAATDGSKSGQVTERKARLGGSLTEGVSAATWRTPHHGDARHWSHKTPGHRQSQGHAVYLSNQAGGRLNPEWVTALMGFPPGWVTDGLLPQDPNTTGSPPAPSPAAIRSERPNSKPSATPSSRKSSRSSDANSSRR